YEGAILRVDATGRVELIIGVAPHGQGTATVLAQVVAAALALEPRDVSVGHGDTALIPFGMGTYASRNAVAAGNAALGAARAVAAKACRLAAHLLEVGEADLELADGGLRVVGAVDRRLSLAELARVRAGFALTAGDGPRPRGDALFPGAEAHVRQRRARGRRRRGPGDRRNRHRRLRGCERRGTADQSPHRRGAGPWRR